jgi:hypothetical protein
VADISDLNKSISQMTNDELMERMRELRLSRRTVKEKPKSESTRKPKTKTATAPVITSDLAQKFLDLLKGS